jgi:hypothetical protein
MVRENGDLRSIEAVNRTLREYKGEFCPTIAIIRGYLPEAHRVRDYCGTCLDGFVPTGRDSSNNTAVGFCKCVGGLDRFIKMRAGNLGPVPSQQERV